jgi:acyl carrier protein
MSDFSSEEALEALRLLLNQKHYQAAVIPANWAVYRRAFKTNPKLERSLFSSLLPQDAVTRASESATEDGVEKISFHTQVLNTAPEHRVELLVKYLRDQVALILRLPVTKITGDRTLGSFGLDSLMAVELRNRLEADLELKLSATLVWNYPTINQLSSFLAGKLETAPMAVLTDVEPASPQEDKSEPDDIGKLLADINDLSDDEVLQSLLRK